MSYTPELVAELEVLRQFNLENLQEGLKVHHEAGPATVAAFGRLHNKGLITQADGGYLTSLGRDAAEQAQTLLTILSETVTA
ncbi:TIGR02647 family protein [Stutzerimonas stutzeri]|uniref:TIGR02647 family protein n=1 Tax=Stutzerimonas stutzeri TaxID=316 RepID=UPI003D066D75